MTADRSRSSNKQGEQAEEQQRQAGTAADRSSSSSKRGEQAEEQQLTEEVLV
jgi:hypothetical protein